MVDIQRHHINKKKERKKKLLPKTATLLPKTATMSKQHSTLSKGQNFTINSFDIVGVFGNKVERCFDIVAGVEGALCKTKATRGWASSSDAQCTVRRRS